MVSRIPGETPMLWYFSIRLLPVARAKKCLLGQIFQSVAGVETHRRHGMAGHLL
jgi:hypothetical protein